MSNPIRAIQKALVVIFVMAFLCTDLCAQDTLKFEKKGYTLSLVNNDDRLNKKVIQNLIDTYFTVYPVLARCYNQNTVKDVEFFIDPVYKGIAEAGGRRVRINPQWLMDHPNDFDLVTHEVMHLVQSYPPDAGPWWITEGIADYVRYVFGMDNTSGGWSLPDYSPGQNYDNGYRVTARFFLWIENNLKPGFIKGLDHIMRAKTYNPDIWKDLTGSPLDVLWERYTNDPTIG